MFDIKEARNLLRTATNGVQFMAVMKEVMRKAYDSKGLKEAEKLIFKERERIFELDSDFKDAVMENETRRKHSKRGRSVYNIKINEVENTVRMARTNPSALREKSVDDWVKDHLFKKTDKRVKKQELFCPICKEPDHRNTLNGIPFCFNCKHQLVSKDELRKYNREYRRKWRKTKSIKKPVLD